MSNRKLREKSKVRDIGPVVKKKKKKTKWKYAGHSARRESKIWAKLATECIHNENKRAKGRPARKWRDDIAEKVGIMWSGVVQDKENWRKIEEGNLYRLMKTCIITNG